MNKIYAKLIREIFRLLHLRKIAASATLQSNMLGKLASFFFLGLQSSYEQGTLMASNSWLKEIG
jgi:hypothetical protein